MSLNQNPQILKHGDVHKRILIKPPIVRPHDAQLGPLNKYRDELSERYNKKKKLFFDTCKKYNRLNQETLICSKKWLLEDYRENLDCDELIYSDGEECRQFCPCERSPNDSGRLYRQRTERSIHQVTEPPNNVCCIEPWFKRHLILNKVIWAARKIVLKNRLLKVLEKLKTVDEDTIEALENRTRRTVNVSYAEIFEKFL